ncbi:MAG: hypothetical protein GXZ10_13370 [Gammaproteobacteria bacterium]|nr:hypothetical protein [Gammaproteobacteria bacterium]
MSLETGVIALAEAIGADVKSLNLKIGDLSQLQTAAKNNLVAAINEAAESGGGVEIDDGAGLGDTTVTWSANKTFTAIQAAVDALVGGAPGALDTLSELAAALGNDENLAQSMITQINNRVRFDEAQVLTAEQQLTACTNIGVGDPTRDFAADYASAKL